jgi:hypothetical protein
MADLMDDALIYWENIEHQQETSVAGVQCTESPRMPILEIIADKNKVSGYKGTFFFKMWPMSGRLEECSADEQTNYRAKVLESKGRRTLAANSRGAFSGADRHVVPTL